jgi:hypothetical protein
MRSVSSARLAKAVPAEQASAQISAAIPVLSLTILVFLPSGECRAPRPATASAIDATIQIIEA